MIRSLRISLSAALLMLSVLAVGCSQPTGTAPGKTEPAGPAPAAATPAPAPKKPAQPYDQLVYLSGTEVKGRLGDPSEVKPQGKGATWRYTDLKLMVSLFEDRVHRVDVEAGPVTEGLAVGDDEAKVQALTAKVEPGSSGIKIYVLEREKLWYRIAVKESKVLKAVVEVPAMP